MYKKGEILSQYMKNKIKYPEKSEKNTFSVLMRPTIRLLLRNPLKAKAKRTPHRANFYSLMEELYWPPDENSEWGANSRMTGQMRNDFNLPATGWFELKLKYFLPR